MSTLLSLKTVRAAKRHQCIFCLGEIAFGEKHIYKSWVNWSDFYSCRSHSECEDYAQKNFDEGDWEFPESSIKRPMTAFDPCI